MKSLTTSLVWGATLFATPGMKGEVGHFSAVLTVVILLTAVAIPLLFLRRGSSKHNPPDSDQGGDGWGKRRPKPPRNPPLGPQGGLPLDDAVPARVRLRGNGRLSDLLPARSRRPAREPERRPVRETIHS